MNCGRWKLLGLALVLTATMSGTTFAEDGWPSRDTLGAMGLSSMTVMSDSDAMSVRGQGFKGYGKFPRGRVAPYSRAFGSSFANIEKPGGDAHTENGYFAEGPYAASGDNFSEAGFEITNIETVDVDGVVKTITTTHAGRVFAGGYSSAMSF
jgi:hypothetical protein